jgi:2-polyprenyl-3-methyl-5-hydroxy-6-metoxy-1,4-benzoquinol methylase
MNNSVKNHFDAIAKKYDSYKDKNWYYYECLKSLFKSLVPEHSRVLEIGCGTGNLISCLNTKSGTGIDISDEMIAIARNKYPAIRFETAAIEEFHSDQKYDYVILVDVIEHLQDVPGAVKSIGKLCHQDTTVIASYANPFWEPVLLLLEKFSMKMPEGEHFRIPFRKLKKILVFNGFSVIERGWRAVLPLFIPFFSGFVNAYFYRVPFIRRLGLIEYIVFRKD